MPPPAKGVASRAGGQGQVRRARLGDRGGQVRAARRPVRLDDRSVAQPVSPRSRGIDFRARQLLHRQRRRHPVHSDSMLNKRGKVAASGPLTIAPLKADLALDLRNVDLLPLQPYVLEQTKIAISRGNLTTKGRLQARHRPPRQAARELQRRRRVANFASVDQNATDFLRWRTLAIGGIDAPLSPLARRQAHRARRFLHRLILDSQGRLNLREIGGVGVSPAAAKPAAAVAHTRRRSSRARCGKWGGRRRPAYLPFDPRPRPAAPAGAHRPHRAQARNVAFSDRFVRPNYDANLTGLAGTITGFSTSSDKLARVEIVGKVDKSAPLSITGEAQPFRQDAHLDILASVKVSSSPGCRATPASTSGYGIAKGKLSASSTKDHRPPAHRDQPHFPRPAHLR